MMSRAALVFEKMSVREKDQLMEAVDVTEPAAPTELGGRVIEVMTNVREAFYPTCSLHNIHI